VSLQVEVVTVTPFQQNCSVVWCNETLAGAVIDPGGDVESIRKIIDKHNIKIEKILLTHGHLDHAGGASKLARQLSIPIVGPQIEDDFWLQGIAQQAQSYGFPGAENCSPDQWLNDGDEVKVGEQTLSVLHCPGHTPGHIVFYNKQSQLAFVGDVLFKGSIGRTDFPKGNHEQLLHSITTKLWPLGSQTCFVSGHGEFSDFASERATNPYVSDRVLS